LLSKNKTRKAHELEHDQIRNQEGQATTPSDDESSLGELDMTEDTEQKLWNMPAIKKQTEVRGDNGEEEERLRLDWGDDEEAAHEGSGVYKKGK
jgi:hypothetical protein